MSSKVPDLDLLCNPFKLKVIDEDLIKKKKQDKINRVIPPYQYNKNNTIIKMVQTYLDNNPTRENKDPEAILLQNIIKSLIQTAKLLLKHKYQQQEFFHNPEIVNDDIDIDYRKKNEFKM